MPNWPIQSSNKMIASEHRRASKKTDAMALTHFILLSLLYVAAYADVVSFTKCKDVQQDQCSISQVRVSPCQLNRRKHCTLYKGTNTTLSFDFVANFAASELETMVYLPQPDKDIAFDGMANNDGCTATTCPLEAGRAQTFNFNLHLGELLPSGSYGLKWKVWNKNDAAQVCCFQTGVRLRKRDY